MDTITANTRPAYTDNQITKLFQEKRMNSGDSIEVLAKKYNTTADVISYIDNREGCLSYEMLEISADYLNIQYEDLTEVLKDDAPVSCRGKINEEAEAIIDIVNILFAEMIMQEKLAV